MIVRAPLRCSQTDIQHFIQTKQLWIQKVTRQQLQRILLQVPATIQEGTTVPYFGNWYPVAWHEQKSPIIDGYCYVPKKWQGELAQNKLIRWLKRQAFDYLSKRTSEWSAYLQIPVHSVTITTAKKRLGSCNRKKEIRYTWRIMMLPPTLIDYIILHELAHIKVHAHNKDFWKIMLEWLPNLPALKQELHRYFIA